MVCVRASLIGGSVRGRGDVGSGRIGGICIASVGVGGPRGLKGVSGINCFPELGGVYKDARS